MKNITIPAALAATLAPGGTALAQTAVQATTDLNVRAGPGSQYPVVGVLAAGQATTLKGCLADGKWCSVGEGWVFSQYLAGDFGGGDKIVVSQRPATAKVAVVEAPDSGSAGAVAGGTTGAIAGAIVAGPVGALVGGVAGATVGGTMGEAIEPPAQVREYVTSHRVDPVYLDGEVVVGASIPSNVQVHEVPDYKYRYVNVNGQEVFVEPGTNRIVHIVR